jgi:hypothetical protein
MMQTCGRKFYFDVNEANDPTEVELGTKLQDLRGSSLSSNRSVSGARSSEVSHQSINITSTALNTIGGGLSVPRGNGETPRKPVPLAFTTGWVLLCTPQWATVSIDNLELDGRLTDKQLFHILRRAYEKKRPPWLLKIRLRAVVKISIVHVSRPS